MTIPIADSSIADFQLPIADFVIAGQHINSNQMANDC